jgi:uncharacterized protein YdaU (DUF1376 family)
MSFGWHPREHRAALDGMLMLTLEERGAYNTILDLIYDRGGPVPDDARWLAGWMGVSLKRWATIRASLLVKGKLYETEASDAGALMNERAALEIENQSKLSRNLRESGAKGGRKRAENAAVSNENNDIDQAPPQAPLKLLTETGTEGSEAKASGDTPPKINPDDEAWTEGVVVLVSQGSMTVPAARTFIGGLLKRHGIEARDLLGPIGECKANRTRDPQAYLAGAAQHRARKREPAGPAKRVGWV